MNFKAKKVMESVSYSVTCEMFPQAFVDISELIESKGFPAKKKDSLSFFNHKFSDGYVIDFTAAAGENGATGNITAQLSDSSGKVCDKKLFNSELFLISTDSLEYPSATFDNGTGGKYKISFKGAALPVSAFAQEDLLAFRAAILNNVAPGKVDELMTLFNKTMGRFMYGRKPSDAIHLVDEGQLLPQVGLSIQIIDEIAEQQGVELSFEELEEVSNTVRFGLFSGDIQEVTTDNPVIVKAVSDAVKKAKSNPGKKQSGTSVELDLD